VAEEQGEGEAGAAEEEKDFLIQIILRENRGGAKGSEDWRTGHTENLKVRSQGSWNLNQ